MCPEGGGTYPFLGRRSRSWEYFTRMHLHGLGLLQPWARSIILLRPRPQHPEGTAAGQKHFRKIRQGAVVHTCNLSTRRSTVGGL